MTAAAEVLPRCRLCAADHHTIEHACDQCPSKGRACEHTTLTCANCGDSHRASDAACSMLRSPQTVQHLILRCPLLTEERNIMRRKVNTELMALRLQTLLFTKAGAIALSDFVSVTGVGTRRWFLGLDPEDTALVASMTRSSLGRPAASTRRARRKSGRIRLIGASPRRRRTRSKGGGEPATARG